MQDKKTRKLLASLSVVANKAKIEMLQQQQET